MKDEEIEHLLGLGQPSRSYWTSYRWSIWVGLAVLGGLAAYILWGPGANDPATQYKTEPVTLSDIVVIVTATGSVEPTNQVDISSELSGTIRKVLVDYNSEVKVGQSLAELDTDKLKASVESSRAKLAAAKAKVKDAEATAEEKRLDYERKRTLVERQVGSASDLEVANAAYERSLAAVESAKADVASAEADLKLNETNLEKTCICSPINGVVLERNVEPGQTVASTLQAPVLFSIAEDLTKMEVQVDVDEADVSKIRIGQEATFTVDAYPDRKFSAKIRELRFGSEIVQGVVTYKAVLTTDNSELLLRPGMTATADITVQHIKDAVSVPNTALRFTPPAANASTDDRSFLQKLLPGRPQLRPASEQVSTGAERKIWILADGTPEEVAITLGPTDGKRTQIVKGDIEPGQAVIVDMATSTN